MLGYYVSCVPRRVIFLAYPKNCGTSKLIILRTRIRVQGDSVGDHPLQVSSDRNCWMISGLLQFMDLDSLVIHFLWHPAALLCVEKTGLKAFLGKKLQVLQVGWRSYQISFFLQWLSECLLTYNKPECRTISNLAVLGKKTCLMEIHPPHQGKPRNGKCVQFSSKHQVH